MLTEIRWAGKQSLITRIGMLSILGPLPLAIDIMTFCICLHPTSFIVKRTDNPSHRSPCAFFFFPASLSHKEASAEERGLRPNGLRFSLHDIVIKLSTMADRSENMSQFHGKKPCRACTDFKSWMRQGNKTKSNPVSLHSTIGF